MLNDDHALIGTYYTECNRTSSIDSLDDWQNRRNIDIYFKYRLVEYYDTFDKCKTLSKICRLILNKGVRRNYMIPVLQSAV
jgi:hypothetical protein